jgi:hypothetical protein
MPSTIAADVSFELRASSFELRASSFELRGETEVIYRELHACYLSPRVKDLTDEVATR